MRKLIIISLLCSAGCNLFSATDRTPDGGVSDTSGADATDVSNEDSSMVDISSTPDVAPPNDGTVDTTGRCESPTGPQLCAELAANCGSPLSAGEAHRWDFEAEDGADGECGISSGIVVLCNSGGTTSAAVDLPVDGDYLFEVNARASIFGEVPALAELTVDGAVAGELPVQVELPDVEAFAVVLPMSAGSHTLQWRFANDSTFAGGLDRNLYVDSYSVVGPLHAPTDSCGDERTPDCGACATNETCGLQRPNECACPCPLDDGSCAGEGTHPTLDCLECTAIGWQGVSGGCSDGDPCTDDSCSARAGMCAGTPIVCERDPCEVGTCNAGTCEFAAAADGDACGVGGECQGGVCGCPNGTFTETNCNDNNDNDCDGLTNCEDPDCDGAACGAGNVCSMGLCQ